MIVNVLMQVNSDKRRNQIIKENQDVRTFKVCKHQNEKREE